MRPWLNNSPPYPKPPKPKPPPSLSGKIMQSLCHTAKYRIKLPSFLWAFSPDWEIPNSSAVDKQLLSKAAKGLGWFIRCLLIFKLNNSISMTIWAREENSELLWPQTTLCVFYSSQPIPAFSLQSLAWLRKPGQLFGQGPVLVNGGSGLPWKEGHERERLPSFH